MIVRSQILEMGNNNHEFSRLKIDLNSNASRIAFFGLWFHRNEIEQNQKKMYGEEYYRW